MRKGKTKRCKGKDDDAVSLSEARPWEKWFSKERHTLSEEAVCKSIALLHTRVLLSSIDSSSFRCKRGFAVGFRHQIPIDSNRLQCLTSAHSLVSKIASRVFGT